MMCEGRRLSRSHLASTCLLWRRQVRFGSVADMSRRREVGQLCARS